jgi:flagellar basal body-associated protein FliL
VNGSKKVLQVKVGVSTYHDKDTLFNEEEGQEGWVPRHLIGIRAQILKVLRSVTLEELQALDGQDNLLEEIKLVINETLEKYEKTTAAPIEEAYFSEFIVQ